MLVADKLETIGTSGYRLSPLLYGYSLNRDESSFSVNTVKPSYIRSRGSRKNCKTFAYSFTHYLGVAGITFILVIESTLGPGKGLPPSQGLISFL